MAKFQVVAPLGATFPAGTSFWGLSDEQVRRRGQQLEAVPGAARRHRAKVPVTFKRGETVDTEARFVPKHLVAALSEAEAKAAAAAAGLGV